MLMDKFWLDIFRRDATHFRVGFGTISAWVRISVKQSSCTLYICVYMYIYAHAHTRTHVRAHIHFCYGQRTDNSREECQGVMAIINGRIVVIHEERGGKKSTIEGCLSLTDKTEQKKKDVLA